MPTPVLVALGSNLGDSAAAIAAGIAALQPFATAPVRSSSLWRTAPVDCPPGSGDFLNAVAAFTLAPHWTPHTLLAELLAIEARVAERTRNVRNAPRHLDLDLVLFGDAVIASPDLTVPHPRALQRRFVLGPAAEIAGDWPWPGTGMTIAAHLRRLDAGPSGKNPPG